MNTIKTILVSLALVASGTASAQGTNLLNGGHEDAPGSLSVAYVCKDWQTDFGDRIYHENLWGEPNKHLHGVQIGLGYAPCTNVGFGIQTGAYFEAYFSYSDAVREQYGYDHYTEYSMYVPAHLMWRVPTGRTSSFTLFGGVGVNWAIYGKFQDDEYVYDFWDDQFHNVGDYSYQLVYGRNGWPKHFNLQAEAGASVRVNNLQLKATYSRGLSDHEFYLKDGNYKTCQDKLSISIGVVF